MRIIKSLQVWIWLTSYPYPRLVHCFTSLLLLPLLLSSKKEKKECQSYKVTDIKSCVAQMDIAGLSLAASYQDTVSFASSHNLLSSLLSLKAVTHQSDIKELVATKATLLSAHIVWNKKVGLKFEQTEKTIVTGQLACSSAPAWDHFAHQQVSVACIYHSEKEN